MDKGQEKREVYGYFDYGQVWSFDGNIQESISIFLRQMEMEEEDEHVCDLWCKPVVDVVQMLDSEYNNDLVLVLVLMQAIGLQEISNSSRHDSKPR